VAKFSFRTVRRRLPGAIENAVEATLRYIGTDQDGRIKLPSRDRVRLVLDEKNEFFRPKLVFQEEPSLRDFFEHHWISVSRLREVVYLSRLLAMMMYVDLPPDSTGYQFREKSALEDSQKNEWEVTRPVLEVSLYRRFHGESKEEYIPWIVERIEAGAKKYYFAERHTGPVVKLLIDGPSKIALDKDVWLRRLTPKERSRLCDPDDPVPSILSDFEASETYWVFEMDVYHITEEEPEYYPADPGVVFEWYLTALRLVKPGSFYIPHVMVQGLPCELADYGHIDQMFSRSYIQGRAVRIGEKELPMILQRFSEIVPILSKFWKDRLDIALDRFNKSFLEQRSADIVIDSAISLEALLLADQAKSSTQLLALRGAVLLGKTIEERQSAIKQFKSFFKMRNHVVHGNTLRKYSLSMKETLDLTRRTFAALLPLLTFGSQKQVLRSLDAYLLSSPTATSLKEFVITYCASMPEKNKIEDDV